MEIVSCPHCGTMFNLNILRADHSKDRMGNQIWLIDEIEWWHCVGCGSRNKVEASYAKI
jgi:hypothetical protein